MSNIQTTPHFAIEGRLERARRLRRDSTSAEERLWTLLRNRHLAGAKFRRQHQIGPYFVDFFCREAALVIEVDGSHHAGRIVRESDDERTAWLEAHGLRVLRLRNVDVFNETKKVLKRIVAALSSGGPHPGLLPGAEGTRLGKS